SSIAGTRRGSAAEPAPFATTPRNIPDGLGHQRQRRAGPGLDEANVHLVHSLTSTSACRGRAGWLPARCLHHHRPPARLALGEMVPLALGLAEDARLDDLAPEAAQQPLEALARLLLDPHAVAPPPRPPRAAPPNPHRPPTRAP